jgi:DnaK suppressor protein
MDEVRHSPLDQKQLNAVKKKLIERKEELEGQLAELYNDESALDQSQDIGDRVQSLSMENLKTSLQDTEIAEYNMIRNALQMIDDGTYGLCSDCGQGISEKRLKLYPNATRCLVCQEILEEGKQEVL